MSLSSTTLHLLTSSTVEFGYCHDRPLRSLATRFAHKDQDQFDSSGSAGVKCSLLMCAGISLQKEAWLPLIKRLFYLTSQPQSRVSIRSVWVIERPNHGDAGLLNEKMLKEHYNVIFPSLQYAATIRAFLASNILSPEERTNLIALGHSGAGGSVIQALEPATSNLPISRLLLVESPLIGRESWEPMKRLYKGVKASNARRQTSWASVEDAMRYFKARSPCKGYHPEVWDIMAETYFHEDPQHPGRVTTKTTVEQETACFVDDGTNLDAMPHLRKILRVLPTHVILGTNNDLWPEEICREQNANIERYRAELASVSYIQGAGHYLPVQMPDELAAEIVRLLNEFIGRPLGSKL